MMELMKHVENYAAAMRLAERHGNKHGDVDAANNEWRKCKEAADLIESQAAEIEALKGQP